MTFTAHGLPWQPKVFILTSRNTLSMYMATVDLANPMAYVPITIINAEATGTYLGSPKKETSR